MDSKESPLVSADTEPSPGPLSRIKLWAACAVVGALIIIVVIIGLGSNAKKDMPGAAGQEGTSDQALTLLLDSLANAASQERLRVGMYRETFANKADAEARKNTGYVASSVVELDTVTGLYRSVFADNYVHHPGFDVGRCLDGVTYNSDYRYVNKEPRATRLKDVRSHLALLPEGHLTQVTENLVNISCPRYGILPGVTADFAKGRLSDGVFPVTLSTEQADAWKKEVYKAGLFTASDEGMVLRGDKNLRKISLRPTDEKTINQELFDIFYRVAGIDQIKREKPDAGWQHGFISINPGLRGSVGGFYLVDEVQKLPVYSELYSTDTDRNADEGKAALKNLARTKQSYAYPEQLTITLTTPLEFLE